MNYQYFIGGSFNDIITDWTWVDGLIIDPIFLMTYVISGGSGYCLAWDEATILTQVLCSLSLPFVCEIPSAALPPTVSPPSTMAPPLTSKSIIRFNKKKIWPHGHLMALLYDINKAYSIEA